MKNSLIAITSLIGSAIAFLLGGWDSSIITLFIFMVIDYITGLIVAGVFHKSKKTDSGSLSSNVGFKGLAKKCVMIMFVIIAHRLDVELGIDYWRTAICIGFMANELISITENAKLMGVPLPEQLYSAIDVLNEKGAKKNGTN